MKKTGNVKNKYVINIRNTVMTGVCNDDLQIRNNHIRAAYACMGDDMGYRIQYDNGLAREGMERKGERSAIMAVLVFFLFLTGVYYFWPEGKAAALRILNAEPVMYIAAYMEQTAHKIQTCFHAEEAAKTLIKSIFAAE